MAMQWKPAIQAMLDGWEMGLKNQDFFGAKKWATAMRRLMLVSWSHFTARIANALCDSTISLNNGFSADFFAKISDQSLS